MSAPCIRYLTLARHLSKSRLLVEQSLRWSTVKYCSSDSGDQRGQNKNTLSEFGKHTKAGRRRKINKDHKPKDDSVLDKVLVDAVHNVAAEVKGNKKQVASDLLEKLQSHQETTEARKEELNNPRRNKEFLKKLAERMKDIRATLEPKEQEIQLDDLEKPIPDEVNNIKSDLQPDNQENKLSDIEKTTPDEVNNIIIDLQPDNKENKLSDIKKKMPDKSKKIKIGQGLKQQENQLSDMQTTFVDKLKDIRVQKPKRQERKLDSIKMPKKSEKSTSGFEKSTSGFEKSTSGFQRQQLGRRKEQFKEKTSTKRIARDEYFQTHIKVRVDKDEHAEKAVKLVQNWRKELLGVQDDQLVESDEKLLIERLGVFEKDISENKIAGERRSLFDQLEVEELQHATSFLPGNAFMEEIKWTKEGKMWKFPIDNEEGMEEEQNVGFYEHIFFDDLLQHFPTTGPVRHFMDLVTVGLSKNPYITAKEKREHIMWFKDYFEDKYERIDELSEVVRKS